MISTLNGKTFACWLVLGYSLLPVALGQTFEHSTKFRAALERWHATLNADKPSTLSYTPYFGDEHSSYFTELNDAVKELASIGANMIPFMVEQIRSDLRAVKNVIPVAPDTNYESAARQNSLYDRLDKDVELMFLLGGIQIRAGMKNPAAAPFELLSTSRWLEQIEGFLKEWDSGVFERLEAKLRAIRKESNEEQNPVKVDYRKTFPYRLYGVYALPILIKEIRDNNSAECFNAFLIITFHRELYSSHYANPRQFYPTISDKMSFIQAWWRENRNKFSELGKLSDSIQASIDLK
jgi:hypothetical protein